MCYGGNCVNEYQKDVRRVHLRYISTVTISTFLSEEINISANSMTITNMKVSSVTAQPEAHSRFMNGVRRWYWCHSALKHSQWKSMGVTCSVMSDRSLFTLLAISHAGPNPWSIEFLYTWCMTPMADILILSVAIRYTHTHTHTHTFRAKFDNRSELLSVWMYSIDMGWQTQEEKHTLHTHTHTQKQTNAISIYRQVS